MNHQAIYATHPNVVLIKENDPTECFDTNGDLVNIDQSLVDAWVDPNAWLGNRIEAYPSWEEQMDMQYWDSVNGTTTWVDAIAQIKSDNPKPA
tara:strand:+ start:1568 stop:1846 length:279 start_codon:yes stop_codon:yes gene_type:complete